MDARLIVTSAGLKAVRVVRQDIDILPRDQMNQFVTVEPGKMVVTVIGFTQETPVSHMQSPCYLAFLVW